MIGRSAGIGLETARLTAAVGADAILAARNPERLEHAADEFGAVSRACVDAAGGPYYAPLAEMDSRRRAGISRRPSSGLSASRGSP